MQNVRIKDVDFDINALLGRQPVAPNQALLEKDIDFKRVMVTGAGGSIGSEICRQVLAQEPSCLVLYELNEYALYSIHTELTQKFPWINIVPVLGSVLNRPRLDRLITKSQIDTIYHAAAYKHVPMVEYNITEGVMNNFVGTSRVAEAAHQGGVETFVLVSTDKAVRPTNVMGASKRLAEMYIQYLANEAPLRHTRFSMVRFGNVLGSSGSVIPLFLEQIAQEQPLTVTHPNITRYFMSIPEASQLVIQAGAMAKGGEVFVLDMGESVKIMDMARTMNTMFNRNPDDIIITGLRPGEKLYEELLIGDNVSPTDHPKIMKANEPYSGDMYSVAAKAGMACDWMEYNMVMDLIREHVSGFQHDGKIHDHLYEHR